WLEAMPRGLRVIPEGILVLLSYRGAGIPPPRTRVDPIFCEKSCVVSQTRIKRRLPAMEAVEFSGDVWTERGERVYKTLRITLKPRVGFAVCKVLQCENAIGITEEWIEDTIVGCFDALEKDYPADDFKLIVHRPNDVSIEYCGSKGTRDMVTVNLCANLR